MDHHKVEVVRENSSIAKSSLFNEGPGLRLNKPRASSFQERDPNTPSSPTDVMLSPCSRRLLGRKSRSDVNKLQIEVTSFSPRNLSSFDLSKFIHPCAPPYKKSQILYLASLSLLAQKVLNLAGWNFAEACGEISNIHSSCSDPYDRSLANANQRCQLMIVELQKREEWGKSEGAVVSHSQVAVCNDHVIELPRNSEEMRLFWSTISDKSVTLITSTVVYSVPSLQKTESVNVSQIFWQPILNPPSLEMDHCIDSCGSVCIDNSEILANIKAIEGPLDAILGFCLEDVARCILKVGLTPDEDHFSFISH